MRWFAFSCVRSDGRRRHFGRGRKPVRPAPRPARQPGSECRRYLLLRERRPHHRQPRDDAGRQFAAGPSCLRLYPADRPLRDLTEPAEPHADHQDRAGRPAGCAHCRRSRPARRGSSSGCRTNGTASSSSPAPRGRAASSTAISLGAITCCSKGYAYVSQNKGVLNLFLVDDAPPDPLGCRLNPSSTIFVHFYDNDPATPFTRWTEFMNRGGAHRKAMPSRRYYGRSSAPHLCGRHLEWRLSSAAGARDRTRAVRWRDRLGRDVCRSGGAEHLERAAPAILNFPDYAASGFDSEQHRGQEHRRDRLPARPRVACRTLSVGSLLDQFWEVTLCQWQKRLDPTYDTYGSGTGTYSYVDRLSASDVGANVAAITTTGDIGKPLITVAGTMDALLPINLHARAYARAVAAALSEEVIRRANTTTTATRAPHTASTRCRTATTSRPTRTPFRSSS